MRDGNWLNQKNARIFSFLICGAMIYWAFTVFPPTFDTDFISFYAAAIEVSRGIPAAAYDSQAHHLTQTIETGCCSVRWYAFYYPPVMLLLVWPLALLPFKAAFFMWGLAQLSLFCTSIKLVLGRKLILIPFLAFPSVFLSLEMGQNALLTAAIFAGATAAWKYKQPLLAGVVFGCLIYKPNFGFLLPIAFIAGREWKMFIGTALTSCLLVLGSLLAFGFNTWFIYLTQTASAAMSSFTTQDVSYAYLVSPYAAARLLGLDNFTGGLIQMGCTALSITTVWIAWSRSKNIAVRSAILIAATMLATPVILFYDLLLTVVVIAWIAVDAKQRGWMPWEKTLLCSLYILAFIAPWASEATNLPYGLMCSTIVMILAWKRLSFLSNGKFNSLDTPPGQ